MLQILLEEGEEKMNVSLVFLTGVLSLVTQYCAVIVTTVCIVDFFSYKTKRILLIAASYLFLLPIIQLAIADFLVQTHSNGNLHLAAFRLSYGNILSAITLHVLLGLLVIVLYSGSIKSGMASLVRAVRKR